MLLQPFRVDLPLGRPGQLMRFPREMCPHTHT